MLEILYGLSGELQITKIFHRIAYFNDTYNLNSLIVFYFIFKHVVSKTLSSPVTFHCVT